MDEPSGIKRNTNKNQPASAGNQTGANSKQPGRSKGKAGAETPATSSSEKPDPVSFEKPAPTSPGKPAPTSTRKPASTSPEKSASTPPEKSTLTPPEKGGFEKSLEAPKKARRVIRVSQPQPPESAAPLSERREELWTKTEESATQNNAVLPGEKSKEKNSPAIDRELPGQQRINFFGNETAGGDIATADNNDELLGESMELENRPSGLFSPEAQVSDTAAGAALKNTPTPSSFCQAGHPVEGDSVFCSRCGLSERYDAIRNRAKEASLKIDESQLLKLLTATSKSALEEEWVRKRILLPDSDNVLLQSLLERKTLSVEDLLIVLCAEPSAFIIADKLIDSASSLAAQTLPKRTKQGAGIKPAKFVREEAIAWLRKSRSELFDELESRIASFARCGIEAIDAWADAFRLDRRLSLERCLVLLSVPADAWVQLPRQEYIAEILKFGERRIMSAINQGPLVSLRVTRNTTSLDLQELGSVLLSSEEILQQLLLQKTDAIKLDSEIFQKDPLLDRRIRGLIQKTTGFKRDTGKHGLFLGFPFIAMKNVSADGSRTKIRIAPILLFPVRMDAQIGATGKVSIFSCPDSDEVRLNPALTGILELDNEEEEKWRQAVEELLSQSSYSAQDIVEKFKPFCAYCDSFLLNVPDKDAQFKADKKYLSYSAAIFHCDFAGKAVADDLRNICERPISGTALELALRLAKSDDPQNAQEAPSKAEIELPLEMAFEKLSEQSCEQIVDAQDFGVVAADPSQEHAVQQARQKSGLHIEGPPGTGKSQTIVNIIADCVARNETVLVVCQKQAALSVVEKRLKAEGLGRRLFYITDVSKDRQSVVRALREQLDERAAGLGAPVSQLRKDRASLMTRIQSIEAELNKHHEALHRMHEKIGLSYRNLLMELIKIEASESSPVKMPRLRTIVKDMDSSAVSALAEECSSIANLWLESKYESSPLHDLKLFSPDEADAQLICGEFERFVQAEQQRFSVLDEFPRSADVDDVSVYVNWLKENEYYIRDIQKEVRLNLSRWVSNFFPDGSSSVSAGMESINMLKQVSESLNKLNKNDQSLLLFAPLASLSDVALNRKIGMGISATKTGGVLVHMNPMRALNRVRLQNYLKSLGQQTHISAMKEFLRAALLEREVRAQRRVYEQVCKTLGVETSTQALDLRRLQNAVSDLLSQLMPVAELASRLRACPLPNDAKTFASRAAATSFDDFNNILKGVIKRHAAKTESLNRLNRLSEWFVDEWVQAQKKVISAGRGNIEALRYMQSFLQMIIPFQEFRLRVKFLSPQSIEVFAALREHEAELNSALDAPANFLHGLPSLPIAAPAAAAAREKNLSTKVRLIIRREACLAWKSQLETEEPSLTIAKEEINFKVKGLAEADEQLRRLNRKILADPGAEAAITGGKKWEDITRLSGARAKRLREMVSNGIELGLMKLRPIWLMNPETASRLLPLSPGLFDVVIFDEASQLLIEYAFPALFRAKRAIVSGDEKQMPPSNFFAAKIQTDESEEFDEDQLDYLESDAERERLEEEWNRREIIDCPDLLNLASAVLPSRSLQIHYRSTYRELIAFSNTAFYSRTLSIPSKRPVTEVRKTRPIELINVDSVYDKQVNVGEAWKVAEILRDLWSAPQAVRPTVGVISFNLKQANLIVEVLNEMALKNESFKAAYEEESKRKEDGEDVGFFVKNLENVQGDERDIIIFSTTFGKDPSGAFRRNFGKLGQLGGERRLNVAVTRAKNKIIMVSSLPVEKISDFLGRSGSPTTPRDFFQAYMSYASKVSSGALEAAEKGLERLSADEGSWTDKDPNQCNPFVQDVAAFIRSLGYEPVIDKPDENDAFGIDIAIVNPATGLFGLGIECDAPSHRLLKTARHREIWRQSVLSRSLGKIHRITAREWYQKNSREKDLLRQAIAEALGHRLELQAETTFNPISKVNTPEFMNKLDNGEQQSLW